MTPDPLASAREQLDAVRQAITSLDARESTHYDELAARTAELAALAGTLTRTFADDTATLTRLDQQVTSLTRRLARLDAQDGPAPGQPAALPAPGGPGGGPGGRLGGLRDWVERVYRPGYGHLAVLNPCWPQHGLCLYGLDILHQLWTALYADPGPVPSYGTELLTAQAEYQARILPAIAAQLAAETTRCGHPTPASTYGARP